MKTRGKAHRYFLKTFFSPQQRLHRFDASEQRNSWSLLPVVPLVFVEKHYESMRRVLLRLFNKAFRLRLVRKPVHEVSGKPREIRMGKGKGELAFHAIGIRSGASVCSCLPTSLLPGFVILHGLRSVLYKLGAQARIV